MVELSILTYNDGTTTISKLTTFDNYEVGKTYGMTAEFSCTSEVIFTGISFENNCLHLIISIVIMILLSLLYEFIICYKIKLNKNLENNEIISSENKLLSSLIHTIFITLSFILMLGIMSYNMWIVISIILSNGIGFYLFSDKNRKIENNGCCQIS